MYKRGTKGLATALSLTMVLSPIMPVAQAYAEETTVTASEDAIEVVEGSDATPATDPASDNGTEATADDQQHADDQQPADDQQGADEVPENEKWMTPFEKKCDAPKGDPRDDFAAHNATQDTYFSSLEEAVANANEGDTIQVNKDQERDCPLEIEKKITLDLAGHRMTNVDLDRDYEKFGCSGPCSIYVAPEGDLTIEDGSESQKGAVYNTSDFEASPVVTNEGSLTIKGGTFHTDSSQAIKHRGYNLVIDGGAFTGKSHAVLAKGLTSADVTQATTINGGTFKAIGGHSVEQWEKGTFIINGGSFSDSSGNAANIARADDKVLTRADGEEYHTLKTLTDVYDFSGMKYKPWTILRGQLVMCIDIENLPEGTSAGDYTVKYWMGDDETRAQTKHLWEAEDGKNLELLDCPAMRMVDQIHMRVYCKNCSQPIKSLDWSARDYFVALHNDRRQSKEMRHLAAAVLQYGSATQRYYVYRTDELADEGIDEPMACESIPECFAKREYGRTEVASGIAPTIEFEESPDLVFHIHSENGFRSGTTVIRVDNTLVRYNGWTFDPDTQVYYIIEPAGEGNFNLRIRNIRPQLLDHTFKVRIGSQRAFDTTDNPSVKFGQTPYLTIECSALSYAYEKQNEYGYEDVSRALYNYNLAAKQVSK